MATLTTGKTVVLSDGQFQTECTIDDGVMKPFTDHLSYPPGSDPVAALTVRARQRLVQFTAQTKPPALIPPGLVIDLTTQAVPAIAPATKDDVDRQNWLARFQAAREAAAFDNLANLAAYDTALQADCRPEWLELIA